MDSKPILSLCIPTNGADQWVLPTLDAIYEQKCPEEDFEVVVVDNGEGSVLEEKIKKYTHTNLYYKKSAENGFMNQLFALKNGKGKYIKLLNHRSKIRSGHLRIIIDYVSKYLEKRPVLFFSNGHVGEKKEIKCGNFEEFMRNVSFWASWEEGLGIWEEDVVYLDKIKYNEMFPAASILFALKKDSEYIIINDKYSEQHLTKRKRNYNFFKVFAIDYVDMLNELRKEGRISIETFNFLRRDMFKRYLLSYYYQLIVKKSDDSIPLSDVRQYMSVYYSYSDYLWMKLYGHSIARLKEILKYRKM